MQQAYQQAIQAQQQPQMPPVGAQNQWMPNNSQIPQQQQAPPPNYPPQQQYQQYQQPPTPQQQYQQQYQQQPQQQYQQQYQQQPAQDYQQQQYQQPQGNWASNLQNQQQQYQPQPQQNQYGQQQQQPQQFANIAPRTREERNQMGDREHIEQARLRDRIGQYHKYVDNALVNAPDPTSSHFLPENDRFNRDFAAIEKANREKAHRAKQEQIDSRRIQKYERDLKRWEYMEDEQDREQKRVQKMQQKYGAGVGNKGGAAYNILNLGYDNTPEGQMLAQRDNDQKVRSLMRSKNIDTISNSGYNLMNGQDRRQIQVPEHQIYNPPGSSGSTLGKAGSQIFGDGFSGRPTRGMEKQFGKKVINAGAMDAYAPNSAMQPVGGQAPMPPVRQSQQMQREQANQHQGGFNVPQPSAAYGQPAGGLQLPINNQQNQLYGNAPGGQAPYQQYQQQQQQAPQVAQSYAQGGAGSKFY